MGLCPGNADINLFRYRQCSVDHLDAEMPKHAFDPGVPEQELDGPEISCPPIDQGGLCASHECVPRRPVNKNSPGLFFAASR
jgi:hypothetical protein